MSDANATLEHLRYEVGDGVAVITMDRPEARNAFTAGMLRAFSEVCVRASEDPSVRAIVLTGAGGHFAAGADVKAFAALASGGEQGAAATHVHALIQHFHGGISTLARARKPWIAAVDGTAAGGGFSLAIAADVTLASDRAKFTFAYPGIGLAPDGSSSWSLPRLVGVKKALWLAYRNPTLSAEEALALGLVTEVTPAASFEARWRAVARELANGPTLAFGAAKRLLRASAEGSSLEAQMEDEREEIVRAARSDDFREGTTAFAEKRKPLFRGC